MNEESLAGSLHEIKDYIKAWLQDDVRQHDARLEEYRKQTRLLEEIKVLLEGRM